jgi:hypothetical protein
MGQVNPKDRQWLDAEEMVGSLERDQLVSDRSRPVPLAVLSRRARAALWGLRVFVLVVGGMVIYTFFAQL